MASLKSAGMTAEDNDMFTMLVMTEVRTSIHFLVSHVGMGSSRQDLPGDPLIKPAISLHDAGVKTINGEHISRYTDKSWSGNV